MEALQNELNVLGEIYHKGNGLGESLAALKAAMGIMGLCGPTMMPPLWALGEGETGVIRKRMKDAGLA